MTNYEKILSCYWGYSSFRPLQSDIIESIGEGKDTLGLMPTGGGKSITFQVPGLVMPGLCLVITPLVALMKDQVDQLQKKGIKAVCLHSGMSKNMVLTTLDNCIHGGYKFLYISPERLSSEPLVTRLPYLKINMIAVDEAHCISQWGYDFRPSFMQIKKLRDYLPLVPILALTATATPDVVFDIQDQLQFRGYNVFKKSFERKNLIYLLRNVEDKYSYLLKILQQEQGCAIVYTRSRGKTKEISQFLNQYNIGSEHYHAGLSSEIKDETQKKWMQGEKRVMVATNAFGMGIDKSNVRVVVHMDIPDSIEAYFQEAGRAGRDGELAYSVVLYKKTDSSILKRRVTDSYPETSFIRKVYDKLGSYAQMAVGFGRGVHFLFNLYDFCRRFKLNKTLVNSALKILELEGYIQYNEENNGNSLIQFYQSRDSLYQLQLGSAWLEDLISCILRSYAGVFSQLTPIDESLIADRLKKNRDEIYNGLTYLKKTGILQYIPQKGSADISYTMDRLDSNDLLFRAQNYVARKQGYEKRVQSVIKYINNNNTCRSRMLLSYFGEENNNPCGQCDICMKQKKDVRINIKSQLLQLLSNSKRTIHELISLFPNQEEELKETIRQMMEREELKMDSIYISQKH